MNASSNLSILDHLLAGLGVDPGAPFLQDDDGALSRGEFLEQTAARSLALREQGVIAGSRVAIASQRGRRFWIDLVATWAAGGIAVPVDGALTPDRTSASLARVDPDFSIGIKPFAGARARAIEDGASGGGDLARDRVAVDAASPAAILLTSGSTGQPKGVVVSHRALAGNSAATTRRIDLRCADALFISVPFHFTSAICHFLAVAHVGARFLATERKLVHADLYTALASSGATCFGGAPIQIRWLAELGGSGALRLRWVMSSGDHLPDPVIASFRAAHPGVGVFTVYGLTEVAGRFCILSADELDAGNTGVGRPIEGMRVQILDDDQRPVASGSVGEVHAGGDYVFDGYFADPVVTAQCLFAHGFRTGDLGWLDEAGGLHLSGRADDVFKCAGQKVSAVMISTALMNTGWFSDVAVLAVEDPNIGSVARACYVLKPGVEFHKGTLLRLLRTELPANHIPQSFLALDVVPRTGSGKVDRGALRKLAGA